MIALCPLKLLRVIMQTTSPLWSLGAEGCLIKQSWLQVGNWRLQLATWRHVGS